MTARRRDALFYHVVRLASIPLFALYFRLRGEGAERVPRTGPVLLAGNHVSYLDPAVLGSKCRRQVHFLMKASIWGQSGMQWFFQGMEAVPVDRSHGVSREAIRSALGLLTEGKAVGIFPEGSRQSADGGEGLLGVAVLARRSGAPVVPVGIAGTERSMPPGRSVPEPTPVTVKFGEPFSYEEVAAGEKGRHADARFVEQLMRSVRELSGQPASPAT